MTQAEEHEALVERVARAICISRGRDPDAPRWIHYPGGYTEGICWHENIDAANAVLAEVYRTLEKPTPEMFIKAGDALVPSGDASACWTAMLAASPLKRPEQ